MNDQSELHFGIYIREVGKEKGHFYRPRSSSESVWKMASEESKFLESITSILMNKKYVVYCFGDYAKKYKDIPEEVWNQCYKLDGTIRKGEQLKPVSTIEDMAIKGMKDRIWLVDHTKKLNIKMDWYWLNYREDSDNTYKNISHEYPNPLPIITSVGIVDKDGMSHKYWGAGDVFEMRLGRIENYNYMVCKRG